MKTLNVDETLVGMRLDEALAKAGITLSRSKAQALIKAGKVTINGAKEKAHYLLEEGDEIVCEEPEPQYSHLEGEDIPLDIVYEDDDVLVINKPAGLVVHPGNGHQSGTLVNALLYREQGLSNVDDPSRPGLVHRIDKDTSGLLVIAKNDNAHAFLSAQLSDHSMHREYIALVQGIILEDEGKIIAPIGRSKKEPLKNTVDLVQGKEAVTYFSVKQRFKGDNATLIDCRLLTGRTHQIRVHMEYIGHPVIGDPLYGKGNRKLFDGGQLLHAHRLTFVHPTSQKEMSFEAPLPAFFEEIIAKLH